MDFFLFPEFYFSIIYFSANWYTLLLKVLISLTNSSIDKIVCMKQCIKYFGFFNRMLLWFTFL